MTPHGVLENMAALEKLAADKQFRLEEWLDMEVWPPIKGLMPHAVHFDFGPLLAHRSHLDFGYDLYDKGLFRLPFPVIFLTASKASPGSGILAFEFDKDNPDFLFGDPIPAGKKATIAMFAFSPGIIRDNLVYDGVPTMYVQMDEDQINWKMIAANKPGVLRSRKDGAFLDNETDVGDRSGRITALVVSMVTMLMSKDVETTNFAVPDRLNRARALKGKPPVGERRVVKIAKHAVQAQRETGEAWRKSPEMHWRRGHFRKLHRGDVIPIAPTIVNAKEDAVPGFKKYQA